MVLCESQTSLLYKVSSKPARATQGNPVSTIILVVMIMMMIIIIVVENFKD